MLLRSATSCRAAHQGAVMAQEDLMAPLTRTIGVAAAVLRFVGWAG